MVVFEPHRRVVYRNRFLEAFSSYFGNYETRVAGDPGLRAAFVRKFADLAT